MQATLTTKQLLSPWRLGLFNMKPLQEPKEYDLDLLNMRFRMAQDDRYDQDQYMRELIGGAGLITFASESHKDRVY